MKSNDAESARLFAKAEQRGMCVVPSCRRWREILRRQIEQGESVRPMRGMYARASYWNALSRPRQTLHLLRTLQALHPDWVFCCESAAVAFGLPVSYKRLNSVCVMTSRMKRYAHSKDIRWHVIGSDNPVVVSGIRVTSLQRTAFDCMRTVDFGSALAIADAALRISGRSSSSFISHFKRIGAGHRGISHAIRTMYYADALSESGGESIARATMIAQGFALPRLQVEFPQPLREGRFFRVDYLWTRLDGSKVIGELDGMGKYEDATLRNDRSVLRVLADEQHREAQLTLLGMPIVRFSYRDVECVADFVELLKRYEIPQSDDVAKAERRLARSRSAAAQIFAVCDFE